MWPVMTLTLLLQLTYEEQLFAGCSGPAVAPQQEVAPQSMDREATCTEWPKTNEMAAEKDGAC